MATEHDQMRKFRDEMNEKMLGAGHLGIKRFFALDSHACADGALLVRTKELLGLVASLVLRWMTASVTTSTRAWRRE